MQPRKIILHHSATKDSGTVSWQAIRRFHVDECSWNGIGYHFGIEEIQDQSWAEPYYEILFGRMPYEVGAHTTGQNHNSIGICCVGAFDNQPPPVPQWEACLRLVRWLLDIYGLNVSDVYGHRDFANKTCPGKMFDLDKFRQELKGE